jgi:hypothetical protein
LSLELVAELLRNSFLRHAVIGSHFLSDVAVGAISSHSVSEQVVSSSHCALDSPGTAATAVYFPLPQSSIFRHTVSETSVDSDSTYSSSAQVVIVRQSLSVDKEAGRNKN